MLHLFYSSSLFLFSEFTFAHECTSRETLIQVLTLESPHPLRLSVPVTTSVSGLVVVAVGVIGFLTIVLLVLGSDSYVSLSSKKQDKSSLLMHY